LNIQGIKNKLDLHNQRFEKFKNEHNNGKKKTDSENYENYINLYSNVPKKQKAKYNASILIKGLKGIYNKESIDGNIIKLSTYLL
jgi:hypothetical protein